MKGGGQSSKILEKNVSFLTKYGKGMTGIRSTITSLNVFEQREMIKYFNDLGVKYVWSELVFAPVGSKTQIETLDLMDYAREFLDSTEYADSLGICYRSFLACNLDEKPTYHCRACLPILI